MVSPGGVAPIRMVGVSASVNLPLHHKLQKFSSGTGLPGWSQKKGRKTVVCVYGARRDNRGRHTEIRLGTTPSRLSATHLHHLPIFMPDSLPAATLPIYPGLGQAPNMLACIPSGTL